MAFPLRRRAILRSHWLKTHNCVRVRVRVRVRVCV
jgi:hypothetical protein